MAMVEGEGDGGGAGGMPPRERPASAASVAPDAHLLSAAAVGWPEQVAKALAMGAEPDARGGGGETALMRASESGAPGALECVKILLAAGADAAALDGAGIGIFSRARGLWATGSEQAVEQWPAIGSELARAGAEPNWGDLTQAMGRSRPGRLIAALCEARGLRSALASDEKQFYIVAMQALKWGAEQGGLALAAFMRAGANPNARATGFGDCLLVRAVTSQAPWAIKILGQAGAKMDAAPLAGGLPQAPLALAAQLGSVASVEALLEAGAAPEPPSSAGWRSILGMVAISFQASDSDLVARRVQCLAMLEGAMMRAAPDPSSGRAPGPRL